MQYSYARLTARDVDLLRGMLAVFGAAFADRATYLDAVPSAVYLQRLLASPQFVAIAARDPNGAVVGALAGYVLEKFEQDRREIYIYDLAVLEPHRRRGVATQLISTLQGIARDIRAYVIFVQADYGDDPAIRLYEKLGTREEVLHFDIGVD